MSTPKIIAVVFLSLFLTLALFIFGFLFTMKMTALSASYVNSRLDSLPLTSLVEEAEFDETMEDNPELISLIKSVITENEAELKERIGETIDIIYGYLNGKSEDLNMAFVLKDTILDPDFTISIIEKADLTPLVKELVAEMVADADLPYNLSVEPYTDEIAHDLEPWLKEQAIAAIPPIYDYVLGFRQDTDIVIQLEPVREIIESKLKQDFLDSPPAEFAALSTAELEQKFDEVFTEFAGDIWTAIEIDMELMDSDVPSDFAESMAEVEEALSESKQYVGYFNAVYGLLIGFIVLLIAGIILVYRKVKGASRTLGGIFLGYGIVNLIAVFIARGTTRTQMAQLDDVPSSMQAWLTQLATSSLTPLLIMAIVLLIAGAALLAVSFIYKRHQNQTETLE
jgi:tetrahydromethanopterin S-methyltransferase subunit G